MGRNDYKRYFSGRTIKCLEFMIQKKPRIDSTFDLTSVRFFCGRNNMAWSKKLKLSLMSVKT